MNQIKEYERSIKELREKKENIDEKFEQFILEQRHIITNGEEKIQQFDNNFNDRNIKLLDFDASYDEAQISNPWYNKEFRILQTKLFMASLKVRKLFLYKHVSHLKAASIIFSQQKDYLSKEYGLKMIQTYSDRKSVV